MKKTDKQKIIPYVYDYVNAGEPLTIQQYIRLMQWLEGETCKSIAEKDKVTEQAVAHSVKRDYDRIKKFAESNDKDYNN